MKLKMLLASTFLVLYPLTLLANLEHAPHNFKTADGLAVFIDFIDAEYSISYDPVTKTANSVSVIHFENKTAGMPIFDLVEAPTSVLLDGEIVGNNLISGPEREGKFRIALKNIAPGPHTFIISAPIKKGVNFLTGGVSSAFWYSDLDDRSYLETYLPSNFEFDQYKMIYKIDFHGMPKQKIYSNGVITRQSIDQFSVEFPATYTSSSSYFHTAPIGRYREKNFTFHSINGRDLPVITYSHDPDLDLEDLTDEILSSLTKLESLYGPFLHQSLTVFNAGSGGMEYCGATMSDSWALNHELTHSYFARGGLMPANGNAGWIDEAVTSWSDDGMATVTNLGSMRSNMAGHSEYRRYTDMDAYTKGKSFIGHLHYRLQSLGGMQGFLNQLILSDSFKPMTTEEFIQKISAYYAEDMTPLFRRYIYSPGARNQPVKPGPGSQRRVHMKMSIDEMSRYL